ncbi:MAG: hypothetical protein QOE39_22, partial [Bradyrhizobium sp.]|nr:hypothetical protein [Bradyrhizobium sp.]
MTEQLAIRGIRIGMAMLIAASMMSVAVPSSAQSVPSTQTVPIPKPAPKGRNIQMSASDPQRGPMTTGATSASPPEPVIPDPRRNLPANIFAT